MQSGDPDQVFLVLGDVLKQWKATPANSRLYAAPRFSSMSLCPTVFLLPRVRARRSKALQENPKGSETFDYFCEDYED